MLFLNCSYVKTFEVLISALKSSVLRVHFNRFNERIRGRFQCCHKIKIEGEGPLSRIRTGLAASQELMAKFRILFINWILEDPQFSLVSSVAYTSSNSFEFFMDA